MWRAGERSLSRTGAREKEVSVALGRRECGAPGRGEVEAALGVGGGDTDQAGVAFTGRRGGEVDGGGSLGGVGEDCVTGLLLSSDEWGKWKQGEAIFLLRRGQRRIQFGPEGGEYREARADWGSCDGE